MIFGVLWRKVSLWVSISLRSILRSVAFDFAFFVLEAQGIPWALLRRAIWWLGRNDALERANNVPGPPLGNAPTTPTSC